MFWHELTWPVIKKLAPDTPVVIPIAAVEQHGHHLPVATDTMLVGEVMRRVEERLRDSILLTPVMWFGNSEHHLDFPGTLTAAPRVYLDMLNNLVDNCLTHGFKRIVFVNGHGGNIVPGHQALFEARQRHRSRMDLLLLFTSYWDQKVRELPTDKGFHQNRVGHACEFETSMVMRLNPKLVVGDVTKLDTVDWGKAFEPGYRGWITKDRTVTGHIGSPQFATPEKGEILFNHFADGVVAWLERIKAWDGKSWDG